MKMNGESYVVVVDQSGHFSGSRQISTEDEGTICSDQSLLEMEKPFLKKAEAEDEVHTGRKGRCSKMVEKVENFIGGVYQRYKSNLSVGLKITAFILYIVYFGYCVSRRYFDEGSYILTVVTAILVIKILYSQFFGSWLEANLKNFQEWYCTSKQAHRLRKFARYGLYIVATACLASYLSINMVMNFNFGNAQAIFGILVLILLCYVGSYKPSKVNWHPVFWGFVIQFSFAALTIRTVYGYNLFKWIGDVIYSLVRLSDTGSEFVMGATFSAENAGFFFECTGVMVFFNSCIFLLEYYGVLEFIVLKIGRGLAMCLETGPVESVVAAANIFIGLSEAPLLIRPYLPTVTKSELHAIMTCGFSSISGAFMAMFIKVGAPPSHLLTAAVISAPAALAITKLLYPEVESVNLVTQRNIKMRDDSKQRNALQAFSDGALFSIKLVGAIMVNMLAFVSMLSLLNSILVWLGERADIQDMNFQWLSSYLFYPLSFLMGTHPDDCRAVGSLIGVKLMATPFVAYADLGQMIRNRHILEEYIATTNDTWQWMGNDIFLSAINTTLPHGVIQEKSEVIATYALCGISAFPAIGFTMGTLIPMSPERKQDVVSVVIRSFIAGNLANIITGAVAGVMFGGT